MHQSQLRAFHAVASHGGFTAASQALGVGQPTLSTQLGALERYFGVELLHRRGRRVELSELGRDLFKITQRLFGAEAEAIALLGAVRDFAAGHLQIGAVGPYHVTEMLAVFSERLPQIRVTVSIGNSQEMLARLLDFRSDVAILAQIEADARFHSIRYSRHPVVIMAHRDHPWARRASIGIGEFAGQRMIMRETGSTTRRAFERALAAAGVAPEIVMELGSREAVWHAVARNIGIGIVSEREIIPHDAIRILPIADADIHTDEHVVCLAERRDSRLVAAFLAIAEELIAARQPAASPHARIPGLKKRRVVATGSEFS
jgi:LysR family transcriptional regulator, low CO2-responsive transcriptional regulator